MKHIQELIQEVVDGKDAKKVREGRSRRGNPGS